MLHFETRFSSGLGRAELVFGLSDLQGLFHPNDFMMLCSALSQSLSQAAPSQPELKKKISVLKVRP